MTWSRPVRSREASGNCLPPGVPRAPCGTVEFLLAVPDALKIGIHR
jgi:hypothetical protein